MANVWDKPVVRKTSPGKSSLGRTITADWRSIPWKDLNRDCLAEQEMAIEMAEEDNLNRYKQYIDQQETLRAEQNPEGGAYEGNLSDEIPFRKLSAETLIRVKRLASNKTVETFVDTYHIKENGIPLLGQILKHISTYKLATISGQDYDPRATADYVVKAKIDLTSTSGTREKETNTPYPNLTSIDLISPIKLYNQVFTDDTMMGLYQFLMTDSRSSYLEKQYAAPARTYCALVPLIMSAFKFHHNVPYEHWQKKHINGITNLKLADAMQCTEALPSTAEIIAARDTGLMIKSGAKTGEIRNATYTFKLFGKQALSEYPELVQVMASQIWCAHPQNRTKYMILDHLNWDSVPPSLITTEVLAKSTYKHTETDCPWL